MDTQQEQAEDIVESFELFDEWEDRYSLLIDLGRKLPPMPSDAKTEANRIQGCQSMVWVIAQAREAEAGQVVEFLADSDSAIVKGLIAILYRVYSGQSADKILTFDIEGLLERLELSRHLSMNRRNGLHGMIQRIKSLATHLATETGGREW